jgi:hypothetical protein
LRRRHTYADRDSRRTDPDGDSYSDARRTDCYTDSDADCYTWMPTGHLCRHRRRSHS